MLTQQQIKVANKITKMVEKDGMSHTGMYNILCHLMARNFVDNATDNVLENYSPDEVGDNVASMTLSMAHVSLNEESSQLADDIQQAMTDYFEPESEADVFNRIDADLAAGKYNV